MIVSTPLGDLTASRAGDDYYPGIKIELNDEIVAIVEFDSISKSIRTISYNKEQEEPAHIEEYIKKRNGKKFKIDVSLVVGIDNRKNKKPDYYTFFHEIIWSHEDKDREIIMFLNNCLTIEENVTPEVTYVKYMYDEIEIVYDDIENISDFINIFKNNNVEIKDIAFEAYDQFYCDRIGNYYEEYYYFFVETISFSENKNLIIKFD